MNYIKTTEDIPEERSEKIINTFLSCRIGREVSYCHGVSPYGEVYYDRFFALLSKTQVITMLNLMKKHLDTVYSGTGVKCENAASILEIVKNPLLGERLNEIIDYMLGFHERGILDKVFKDQGFKELSKGVLNVSA